MYPHTASGLAACFTIALPWYGRDVIATTVVAGCAFGLEALVKQIRATREAAHNSIPA
jgi:hypothetical protein